MAAYCNTSGSQDTRGRLAAELPFGQRIRRVLDVRVRAQHRTYLPPDLCSVVAHWTTIPAGTAAQSLLGESTEVNLTADAVTVDKEPEVVEGKADVRALIVPGLSGEATDKRHLLRKLRVLGYTGKGGKELRAYGGPTEAEDDVSMTSGLIDTIKAQSGLDLTSVHTWFKFLEIKYRKRPPTVFFVPAHWESLMPFSAGPLTLKADEEASPVTLRSPTLMTAAELVSAPIDGDSSREAIELCFAVDALDEFLKRDMAANILRSLRGRVEDAQAVLNAKKRIETERRDLKRKREEGDTRRKKQREEEMAAMEAQWQEDDEGLTEDEIAEQKDERQKALKEIQDRNAQEDKKALEDFVKTEKQLEQSVGAGEKKYNKPDQTLFDSYVYFDRSPGLEKPAGQLPRLRLENLLLCLEDDLTNEDVDELLVATEAHMNKHKEVSYEKLATVAADEEPES